MQWSTRKREATHYSERVPLDVFGSMRDCRESIAKDDGDDAEGEPQLSADVPDGRLSFPRAARTVPNRRPCFVATVVVGGGRG
jgi:hypothetical protein